MAMTRTLPAEGLEDTEVVREGLGDALRMPDLDAGDAQAEQGEGHRKAVIVVRVHCGGMHGPWADEEAVGLFDGVHPGTPQLLYDGADAVRLLAAHEPHTAHPRR